MQLYLLQPVSILGHKGAKISGIINNNLYLVDLRGVYNAKEVLDFFGEPIRNLPLLHGRYSGSMEVISDIKHILV